VLRHLKGIISFRVFGTVMEMEILEVLSIVIGMVLLI